MYRRVSPELEDQSQGSPGLRTWLRELVPTLMKDSLLQARTGECVGDKQGRARLRGRWLNLMQIFWGFLGLLLSTMLRYLVAPTGGSAVPLTDPVRLLGTVSGVLLSYGTLVMILNRVRKTEVPMRRTQFTDWVFLVLLFLTGASGFVLEASSYGASGALIDAALAAHLIVVFELLIMAPFTKFAHVIYRPFAIWLCRPFRRI